MPRSIRLAMSSSSSWIIPTESCYPTTWIGRSGDTGVRRKAEGPILIRGGRGVSLPGKYNQSIESFRADHRVLLNNSATKNGRRPLCPFINDAIRNANQHIYGPGAVEGERTTKTEYALQCP